MIPPITWAAKTDIGCVRRENQDRWLARAEDGLFAVADGMGGLPGGAEAASLALASLEEEFVRARPAARDAWDALAGIVNDRVRRRGFAINPGIGIGTTLTLLHFTADGVRIVHVGDSAGFLLRAGKLAQLTEDHTVEAEARRDIARGLHVYVEPGSGHILTRCLGQDRDVGADVIDAEVKSGDRFLVCTDGITKVLDDDTIAACLASAATPEDAVARLIAATLAAGAPDNATAIAVFAMSKAG